MTEQVIKVAPEDQRVELLHEIEGALWKAFDFGRVMGVARHPKTGVVYKNIRSKTDAEYGAHVRKLMLDYLTPIGDALDLDIRDPQEPQP